MAPFPFLGQERMVKYLYADKGGSIFQPVHMGTRDDITAQDCGVDQLRYKAEAQDQAA